MSSAYEAQCTRCRPRQLQQPAWTREEFEAQLREKGTAYHIHHPFNVMLNSGGASREQIRGWVANRFYYQISIPIKDAAILSNCPDRADAAQLGAAHSRSRRLWRRSAAASNPGCGSAKRSGCRATNSESLEDVLPGVRFAVDAYVNFARRAPWQEAVCSSLTELFAPQIHKQRLANWPEHYPWIDPTGLHYFQSRVSLARRDVEFGLAVHAGSFQDARAAGARARDPAVQARHAVADDSMPSKRRYRDMNELTPQRRRRNRSAASSAAASSACSGSRRRTRTCCCIRKAW